jgi:hypothetical protein
MTKEEVKAAILELNEKLGHVPSRTELSKLAGVSRQQIRKHFGTYSRVLRECNLSAMRGGMRVDLGLLFRDWAEIVRKLGKLPTVIDYEQLSRYSVRPLSTRFGTWGNVPAGLKHYAEQQGLGAEWPDVMAMVTERCQRPSGRPRPAGMTVEPRQMEGRPMYGRLLRPCPLVCEPTNENGVMFLFGAMAWDLGFMALRIQTGFPDIEAFRTMEGGRLQRVKIELEQESRNFLLHGHYIEGCDLIVCWEHNWTECPIEVIELKKVIRDQGSELHRSIT